MQALTSLDRQRKTEIRQHKAAQYDPIPAKDLKIIRLYMPQQKFNRENRHDKRRALTDDHDHDFALE